MSRLQNAIIHRTFSLTIRLITTFNQRNKSTIELETLRQLPEGTLGRDIANCMDHHGFHLVPGFEAHDLKHALLGYSMSALDEVRLQAFLIGNGNITAPTLAIFIYGSLVFPNKWRTLGRSIQDGFASQPVKHLTLENAAELRTSHLQRDLLGTANHELKLRKLMSRASLGGAFAAIVVGFAAMVHCLPYLYSSLLEDLVGAGIPFLGGAILMAAGLISLAIWSRPARKQAPQPVTA